MKSIFIMEIYCAKLQKFFSRIFNMFFISSSVARMGEEIRWDEHSKAIEKQLWHHSRITLHYQDCHHGFNKENFTPLRICKTNKNGASHTTLKSANFFRD